MAPENAMVMAQNICKGLSEKYPAHKKIFAENLDVLLIQLSDLQEYGANTLSNLSCRELITFHDGFAYFAESFDLTVLKAMEEESGSEASAKELKELVILVHEYKLPAVFTEVNGSTSAAQVICLRLSADGQAAGNDFRRDQDREDAGQGFAVGDHHDFRQCDGRAGRGVF